MAMALPELTVEQWPATSAEPLRLAKNGKRYSWQDFKRYYRAEAEKEWAEAREAEEVQPAENMSGDESSEGSASGGADGAGDGEGSAGGA